MIYTFIIGIIVLLVIAKMRWFFGIAIMSYFALAITGVI
jgi:hypothetical protein